MTATAPEPVIFRSDGLTLAGSFVEVAAPRAVALVLAGSGRSDRNGDVPRLPVGVSRAIAQALAAEHIETLRYDKRGVGASEGNFLTAGLNDNYSDARSALAWLSARCPNLPIFVIGHSEGALHAAHLAAEEQVAGAVLLACPARIGEEILIWQARAMVATLPKWTTTLLKLFHIDPLASQRKQFARIRSTSADVIRVQGKKVNARWLRQFLDYDPVPIFREITVPVLAVSGANDLQVPPEDAVTIAGLVRGVGDVRTIGDLSHLMRPDPVSRGPRDYRRAVHLPVSPKVLTLISGWIPDQLPKPTPSHGVDLSVT
jgi:pimeloyl-ACP methyl ester carboxylesterase